MAIDDETKLLVEKLRYWDAEKVKKMQTKLTKTANCIVNDALGDRLASFYSYDEIKILREASSILRSIKSKVEHVKEIKAREEKKTGACDKWL